MQRILGSGLLVLGLLASPAFAQQPEQVWSISEGIDRPESAYYHAPSKTLFVSVMIGASDEKDGKGFLAKVGLDGKVIEQNWVTGLSAPKGMRVHGKTLWVSDIDRLLGIDLKTGQIVHEVKPEGAQFLNDVATGDDGTVYVSDMRANKILTWKDGKLSTLYEAPLVQAPNGLLVEKGKLIVGCRSGEDEKAHLYAIDLASGQASRLSPATFGNADGIESDGAGGYLVSDWPGATVTHIPAQGDAKVILKAKEQGTADIAYVVEENLLVVPHMVEGRVAAYRWTKE